MSHGLDLDHASADPHALREARAAHPILGAIEAALAAVNRLIVVLASVALVAASLILSYSVVTRFVFHTPTYWQDEASVFLLVGTTFMTAAYVQSRRGHVAIEALTALLSPRVNKARLLVVDAASFAFCAFFAWKSYVLLHEAWVDGHVSSSTWGPPLWIPYGVMTLGMALLSAQILLQIASSVAGGKRP